MSEREFGHPYSFLNVWYDIVIPCVWRIAGCGALLVPFGRPNQCPSGQVQCMTQKKKGFSLNLWSLHTSTGIDNRVFSYSMEFVHINGQDNRVFSYSMEFSLCFATEGWWLCHTLSLTDRRLHSPFQIPCSVDRINARPERRCSIWPRKKILTHS